MFAYPLNALNPEDEKVRIRMWLVAAFGLALLEHAPHLSAQAPGQIAYIAKCASCHGMTGMADTQAGKTTNAQPFNGSTVAAMSDATLLGIIKNGSGKMPAYNGKISEDEASKLIQYIHQLQTAK